MSTEKTAYHQTVYNQNSLSWKCLQLGQSLLGKLSIEMSGQSNLKCPKPRQICLEIITVTVIVIIMIIIIIIIIIIIVFKGAIPDFFFFFFFFFLQSHNWPGRSRVQITCNTLSAYHLQHVVLRATWYEGTAQLFSMTDFKSNSFELYSIG